MSKYSEWIRNGLAGIGIFALGAWLGNARAVKASSDDVTFQAAPIGANTALMVYRPSTRSVYVYQGATTGSANLQCSYKYVLGSAPSDGMQRVPCPVPTMH